MTVADTILSQLGGSKFAAMTGARAFVGSSNSLQFSIPRNRAIDKVFIELTELDLYNVTFFSIRGASVKAIRMVGSVDATQLREVFTMTTGLETNLGTMGRED